MHNTLKSAGQKLAPWATLALLACGSEGGGSSDGGGGGSTARTPDPVDESDFSIYVVDDGDVGQHIQLALDSAGEPVVSYFASHGVTMDDCEVGGVKRIVWPLYAAFRTLQVFERELVTDVLSTAVPQGQSLAVNSAGEPVIAALTGGPLISDLTPLCAAHDLGLYQRSGTGTWEATTLVQTSGEAAVGDQASDYGEVVGHWPALGFADSGAALVAYKDVHAGGVQGDDRRRADLEWVQYEGGNTVARMVDQGRGGGIYNELAVDSAGRIVIAYYLEQESTAEPQQGLWVARSEDGGVTFDKVRIFPGALSTTIALAVRGEEIFLLYQDPELGLPILASLVDPASFTDRSSWGTERIGDSHFVEGQDPDLVVGPDGGLWAAYYRCADTSAGSDTECDSSLDGLVLASQIDGDWELAEVDQGEDMGECGRDAALAVSSTNVYVAYRCQGLEASELVDSVRLAQRVVP